MEGNKVRKVRKAIVPLSGVASDSSLREQACDLCYRKKIKCDGKTPLCSHCLVYKSECTYLAASRKKKPRKASSGEAADMSVEASLRSRIEILEDSLREALQENSLLKNGRPDILAPHAGSLIPSGEDDIAAPSDSLELPPEDVVYPLVQGYLSSFNSIYPLFDGQELYNTVDKWYRNPLQRSSTSWAAVNIAMALAQYQGNGPKNPRISVTECLDKVQSALTEILMGDMELANIQVVLGLVVLFLATPDHRPASIFMAMAMKLVHAMGIHRREGYDGIAPSEILQRKRVFWIAYILDRDISLRTRQPPVQHDLEIDLDLPSETPDPDGAGFVTAAWTYETFNFFLFRVQLAQIQGQVYDCLYSVRAQQMNSHAIVARAAQLQQSIHKWQSTIPPSFSAEILSQDSTTVLPQYFCQLYSTCVSCLGLLCRVTAMELHWVETLMSYARKMAAGERCTAPAAPQGWDILVNNCRSMMNLFTSVQHKESAFIWYGHFL
ncbi:hypothetical protein S40293_08939 [Stachybotrys chartarum IBT 40293]|nr:hypothetical protein S40293_08939 [Stachybotrys chartarum IBT 40293]